MSWPIPENTHILLQYCCQDGTGGIYDSLPDDTSAYIINGNTLTVFLVSAVCAVVGETKLQVTLLNDGVQLSSFPVVIQVTPQVNAQVESGEYTNLMQWWILRDIKGEKGDSGVYVGSGEMPAGYNVQVDPTGDESILTPEEVREIAGLAAAHLTPEMEKKLDRPVNTPVVGKVPKVQSVNADGTFTCAWAYADNGVYVGSGEMPAGCNVQVDPTGDESILTPEEVQEIADCAADLLRGEIDNKLPKSPDDWEAWTDEEQAAARDRMGLENTCELIETWTNDTEEPVNFVRTQTPDGTPYGYKHMLIRMLGGTAQDAWKLIRCYLDGYSIADSIQYYAVASNKWDLHISIQDGFVVMENNQITVEGSAPHTGIAYSHNSMKYHISIQPKSAKKIVKIEIAGIPAGSTLYIWGTK